MNFRTLVELPEKQTEIRHSEQIMLFGSCFAENVGRLLVENKFRCDVNPFGILYNPLSIAGALEQLVEGKVYAESDLFQANGLWHSWMHHGDFSAPDSGECLDRINARLSKASEALPSADWLVVTFGTAYVYVHREMQTVVGNCHKVPEKTFARSMPNVSAFVEKWQGVLKKLRDVNPKLKVLFTVSPIRHAKDGMHGNQLSKATLLLTVEELCRTCPDCHYFPSYEILMDELRDYRFYADDMLHPSPKAVEYIWECFSRCYFSAGTLAAMKEWADIRRGINHRPFNPHTEAYREFLSQIVLKIAEIKEKLPYLEVQNEKELCESRLKTLQIC